MNEKIKNYFLDKKEIILRNKEDILMSLIIWGIIIYFKWPFESIFQWFIWGLIWGSIILIFLFENLILKNISVIVFLLIVVFLSDKESINEYKDFYLLIWALVAFWYWYKKYERDKELEVLEKYWKKYDELKAKKNYWWILSLCEEEYYLYKKNYISEDLWKRISHKIDKNLGEILRKAIESYKEDISNIDKPNDFIQSLFNDDILCSWKWFWNHIIWRLDEIKEDRIKIVEWKIDNPLYKQEEIINQSRDYIALINIITEMIKETLYINKEYFNN